MPRPAGGTCGAVLGRTDYVVPRSHPAGQQFLLR